jgi:glycosyltransferase involved in cell wall biosynthesis
LRNGLFDPKDPEGEFMPTVLWWGRSDPGYSRNQIIVNLLSELGWRIEFFHPVSSLLGRAQAFFQHPKTPPQLIWVPCFRQRDMRSAIVWARRWKCPLVFDPLISAYQKEVFEKGKWSASQRSAIKLRSWEATLFRQADLVIADTRMHARFFAETFDLDPDKIRVVYVGADDAVFRPADAAPAGTPVEVLFYGSFLALQGPEYIIDAAMEMENRGIRWVLLGDGDLRARLEARSSGVPNVRFEPWLPYELLPKRLARAHILLGIFGTTPKAAMVIPNKVFQSMAVGRPLITRRSEAYPQQVRDSGAIGWVPPGDARAIARQVTEMAADPQSLLQRGRQTRQLYDQYFSLHHIRRQLQTALDTVMAAGR